MQPMACRKPAREMQNGQILKPLNQLVMTKKNVFTEIVNNHEIKNITERNRLYNSLSNTEKEEFIQFLLDSDTKIEGVFYELDGI
jgi:hypothetical protein